MSRLHAGFLAAAATLAFAAFAIEPPQAPPGTAAKQEPEQQEPEEQKPARQEPAPDTGDPSAPPQEPAAEDDELPPLPPDAASAGPSPQRFNPTEKVRADFPVSFPIDI